MAKRKNRRISKFIKWLNIWWWFIILVLVIAIVITLIIIGASK